MAVRLDPFQNITGVGWPDARLGPFWILSGEQIVDQFGIHFHRRGAVGGYELGNGDSSQWHLVFRNPDDLQWIATGAAISTEQTSGGSTVSTMEISFTGQFEDEERQENPPFNPNDIDWLDGMIITIEGWGDTPELGGAELQRFFVESLQRTRFVWVEPTTTGIPLLPLSADSTDESQYEITYPGSEDI